MFSPEDPAALGCLPPTALCPNKVIFDPLCYLLMEKWDYTYEAPNNPLNVQNAFFSYRVLEGEDGLHSLNVNYFISLELVNQ